MQDKTRKCHEGLTLFRKCLIESNKINEKLIFCHNFHLHYCILFELNYYRQPMAWLTGLLKCGAFP